MLRSLVGSEMCIRDRYFTGGVVEAANSAGGVYVSNAAVLQDELLPTADMVDYTHTLIGSNTTLLILSTLFVSLRLIFAVIPVILGTDVFILRPQLRPKRNYDDEDENEKAPPIPPGTLFVSESVTFGAVEEEIYDHRFSNLLSKFRRRRDLIANNMKLSTNFGAEAANGSFSKSSKKQSSASNGGGPVSAIMGVVKKRVLFSCLPEEVKHHFDQRVRIKGLSDEDRARLKKKVAADWRCRRYLVQAADELALRELGLYGAYSGYFLADNPHQLPTAISSSSAIRHDSIMFTPREGEEEGVNNNTASSPHRSKSLMELSPEREQGAIKALPGGGAGKRRAQSFWGGGGVAVIDGIEVDIDADDVEAGVVGNGSITNIKYDDDEQHMAARAYLRKRREAIDNSYLLVVQKYFPAFDFADKSTFPSFASLPKKGMTGDEQLDASLEILGIAVDNHLTELPHKRPVWMKEPGKGCEDKCTCLIRNGGGDSSADPASAAKRKSGRYRMASTMRDANEDIGDISFGFLASAEGGGKTTMPPRRGRGKSQKRSAGANNIDSSSVAMQDLRNRHDSIFVALDQVDPDCGDTTSYTPPQTTRTRPDSVYVALAEALGEDEEDTGDNTSTAAVQGGGVASPAVNNTRRSDSIYVGDDPEVPPTTALPPKPKRKRATTHFSSI
eukprot:TRINITY_DN17831_c0_g1_i3.p1 TRINITY_DN17831_c0_g1~~TRINITY_DN17831_c0_g1_i3.p1  ORF type:complete len:709 (-),score=136.21 TRINITY_DN17831_c0_g1_i3:364-2382(-)